MSEPPHLRPRRWAVLLSGLLIVLALLGGLVFAYDRIGDNQPAGEPSRDYVPNPHD